jgi:PurA-like ssDNA and RNA-binding protein
MREIIVSKQYMINPNPGGRPTSDPIASEKIAVERKIFFLDLKENQRGRFLKITEDVGGRRDTIMLPASAFQDFADAFARLVEFEKNLPAQ